MFITYKKGLQLNSQNPTLLYAYGGFNVSSLPAFSATLIPFLEQGVYMLWQIFVGELNTVKNGMRQE
jgi:prolyl oligopeptidase